MLTANMRSIDSKLTISRSEHEELIEIVSKANALTQVISMMPTEKFQFISHDALYTFLTMLDDLTFQANKLCRAVKPQASNTL